MTTPQEGVIFKHAYEHPEVCCGNTFFLTVHRPPPPLGRSVILGGGKSVIQGGGGVIHKNTCTSHALI